MSRWVVAATLARLTADAALHPNAAGMCAVAELIAAQV
jgi:hypothetical protein